MRKSLLPAMAMKRKAYIVSTMLQTMVVAEKATNKVAVRQFSADSQKICGGLMMLTISDHFRLAQIVRQLQTTTLPTACTTRRPHNNQNMSINFSYLLIGSKNRRPVHEHAPVPIERQFLFNINSNLTLGG